MRRWFRSAARAVLLMLADVAVFVAFGITMGAHSPRWITQPLFWMLAWPVAVFKPVFPNHTPGAHAPSLGAWAAGALVDLIWVTLLVDWLWRPRGEIVAADTNDDRGKGGAGV
jgi:hypothetical protein